MPASLIARVGGRHCAKSRLPALTSASRWLTGEVSQAPPELPRPEPRGQKWLFPALLLGGLGVGYVLVDVKLKPLASELFRGKWRYDWDAEWRLFESPTGQVKENSVGVLESIQSGTYHRRPEPTPYRSTKQVLLVRHGQYKNPDSQDDDEQGLTDLGKEQAAACGQRLAEVLKGKKVRGIFHSDMKRARETAEIVSKYLPGISLREDPALAEGVPAYPDPPSSTFKPTSLEVEVGKGRIERAFRKYFYRPPTPEAPPRYDNEYDVYDVLVCHGNVIRYMFCRALQFPETAWLRLSTYNCGITWLIVSNMGFVAAREFGDVGFLPFDKITYS